MILWIYPDEAMPDPGTLCVVTFKGVTGNLKARLAVFDGKVWNIHPYNGARIKNENVIAWCEVNGPHLREGSREGNSNQGE